MVYPPLRTYVMKTMLKTIHTEMFVAAAEAASAPCRYAPVNDGRRLDSVTTLAERRVR
jgi:hypothetical protein